MQYEALRKKYKNHAVSCARLLRLTKRAASGELSPDRLMLCNLAISSISSDIDRDESLFNQLEKAGDPAWRKMSRELDAALAESTDPNHNPIGMGQMVKKFVGTMSLLILGTWMIDGLRKK